MEIQTILKTCLLFTCFVTVLINAIVSGLAAWLWLYFPQSRCTAREWACKNNNQHDLLNLAARQQPCHEKSRSISAWSRCDLLGFEMGPSCALWALRCPHRGGNYTLGTRPSCARTQNCPGRAWPAWNKVQTPVPLWLEEQEINRVHAE